MAAFRKARELLKENPYIGHAYEGIDTVREYPIQSTNFSILYSFARETIWVIDIRDARGLRSAEALSHFAAELREQMRGEG